MMYYVQVYRAADGEHIHEYGPYATLWQAQVIARRYKGIASTFAKIEREDS